MFNNINPAIKPQNPRLYIAKPDKTIVGELKEAYNTEIYFKLAVLNELAFEIPYDIEIKHVLQHNKNIDNLLERYLIKYVNENYTEWFVINKLEDTMDGTNEIKKINCMSLGYELADKNIRGYTVTSYNPTQVLTDALSNTNWSIGFIDSTFTTLYRSFNVSSKTVLDFVFEIATTFVALAIWDTVNRTVSLYNLDNFGADKGLTVSYDKLLKSIDYISNPDEMATRLKCFGYNGLSIQSVNPTGSNYIENFSFFLDTYLQDINGNILSHSRYMSDGLCKAILAYNTLVQNSTGQFNTLIVTLSAQQSTLTTQKNDLNTLSTQMNVLTDQLDVAQSTSQPTATILSQIATLQTQINSQNALINTSNINISTTQASISALQATLSIANNFTSAQIIERNQYIIEKVWEDTNYIIAQDLYNDGLKKFEALRTPQLAISIDIVNLLEIIGEQHNWEKLNIGDIITVYYPKLKINIKTKINEIRINFGTGNITIAISNIKTILTDEQKFLNSLYGAISTSNDVNKNMDNWNNITSVQSSVQGILDSAWSSAKNAITASVNNSILIDRRGITATDSTDPLKLIRMTNSVLGLSADGGNTFSTAITPKGIVAQRLVGQILAGVNLTIDATDLNSNKTFTVDSTGVKISGLALTITDGGLPPSQLDPAFKNSLVNLSTSYNGVVINSANGLVVTRSDNKVKSTFNATNGILIQKSSDGTNWANIFSVDTSGNINMTGNLVVGSNTLINSATRTIDFGQFTTKLGTISGVNNVDSINPSQINAGTINASISITSPTIIGGTITGSTVSAKARFNVSSNIWEAGVGMNYGIYFGGVVTGYDAPCSMRYFQGQYGTDTALNILLPTNAQVYINQNLQVEGGVTIGNGLSVGVSIQTPTFIGDYVKGTTNPNIVYIGSGGSKFENTTDGVMRLKSGSGSYLAIAKNGLYFYRNNGTSVQLA